MIVIDKGRHQIRGFLSYYISILTSFRDLINSNVSLEEIGIDPYIFYTYGIASNWFEEERLITPSSNDSIFYSTDSWNISPWPTKEELDLNEYRKYLPYNDRINSWINNNLPQVNNFLGIHFRGTDHYHTDRVEVQSYLSMIDYELSKNEYAGIFLATDEDGILEKFQSSLSGIKIIHNDTIKASGNISIFDTPMELDKKILAADQVLLDSHSLALCKKVLGKMSNVTHYSRILNPSLEMVYLDIGSVVR